MPRPAFFHLVYRRFDRIEFDRAKSDLIYASYGFDFGHASRMFPGLVLEREDTRPYGERRFQVIGQIADDIITLVYTPRDGGCRLITASRAELFEEELWADVLR